MISRRSRAATLAAVGLALVWFGSWTRGEARAEVAESSGRAVFARLLAGDPKVLVGREGWLFLPGELSALLAPRLRGLGAAGPPEADPLPAILDFHAQLRRAGIDLLLVPVPPKLSIYPDRLAGEIAPAAVEELGQELAATLDEISRAGVAVLDLSPLLRRARSHSGDPLYCRSDSHWSPGGLDLAARAIAEKVGRPPWLAAVSRRELTARSEPLQIDGDLWRLLPEPRPARERLTATVVAEKGASEPLAAWRESPVLLLGDSHVLVFHAGGELHARGAGLPEHLALALGFPVDVVGVRGSGGTPARVNLLRRGDGLAGKKLVIWVFAARELAAGGGWKKVPIVR